MAAGHLAQAVHPVPKGVPVDAEALGRLAPAAAGVEQPGERVEQPRVSRRRAEDAVDEGLERSIVEIEQQLERAEVTVGRDAAVRRVQRRAGLQQAATEL